MSTCTREVRSEVFGKVAGTCVSFNSYLQFLAADAALYCESAFWARQYSSSSSHFREAQILYMNIWLFDQADVSQA